MDLLKVKENNGYKNSSVFNQKQQRLKSSVWFSFFNLIEINYSKHRNVFSAINIKSYVHQNEINF